MLSCLPAGNTVIAVKAHIQTSGQTPALGAPESVRETGGSPLRPLKLPVALSQNNSRNGCKGISVLGTALFVPILTFGAFGA